MKKLLTLALAFMTTMGVWADTKTDGFSYSDVNSVATTTGTYTLTGSATGASYQIKGSTLEASDWYFVKGGYIKNTTTPGKVKKVVLNCKTAYYGMVKLYVANSEITAYSSGNTWGAKDADGTTLTEVANGYSIDYNVEGDYTYFMILNTNYSYTNEYTQLNVTWEEETAGEATACAKPTITANSASFGSGTSVTVATSTEGAALDVTVKKNGADYISQTRVASPYTFTCTGSIGDTFSVTAVAKKSDLDDSEEASESFTIVPATPYIQGNPTGVTVGETITLVADEGATINYTLKWGYYNSDSYMTSSTTGSGTSPLTVTIPEINNNYYMKVIATATVNGATSAEFTSGFLRVTKVLETLNPPTVTVNGTTVAAGGSIDVTGEATITLTCDKDFARPYYKIGSGSLTYVYENTVTFKIEETATIETYSYPGYPYSSSYNQSDKISFTVNVTPVPKLDAPTFSLADGYALPGDQLTITAPTGATSIVYTVNGTETTTTTLPAVITLPDTEGDVTVTAVAKADGYRDSDTATLSLTLSNTFLNSISYYSLVYQNPGCNTAVSSYSDTYNVNETLSYTSPDNIAYALTKVNLVNGSYAKYWDMPYMSDGSGVLYNTNNEGKVIKSVTVALNYQETVNFYVGTEPLTADNYSSVGKMKTIYGGDGTWTADGKYGYIYYCQTGVEMKDMTIEWAEPTSTVTFTNNRNWDKVAIYTWKGDTNNGWPGVELTANSEGKYVYTVKDADAPEYVIFTNGDSSDLYKTGNLEFTDGAEFNGFSGLKASVAGVFTNWDAATNAVEIPADGTVEFTDLMLCDANGWNFKVVLYNVLSPNDSQWLSVGGALTVGTEAPVGNNNDVTYINGGSTAQPYNLTWNIIEKTLLASGELDTPDMTVNGPLVDGQIQVGSSPATVTFTAPDGVSVYYKFTAANGNANNALFKAPITDATEYTLYSEAISIPVETEGELSYYAERGGVKSAVQSIEVKNIVTTGVDSILAEGDDATYFNLQGVRISNPEKGIYIRVKDGKSTHVIVK